GRRDRWTGPAEILGEGIELLSQHAVRKLRHRGGRVTEAETVALASGRAVTVTADTFVVVPMDESRPWHALLLCDSYDASVLEGRVDDALLVGLYWYTLMEPRRENRIVFGRATDAVGLPQPTFEYALEQADRDRLQAALEDLRAAGGLLGTFLPTSPPQMRSAGSSMHLMGTTRT